MNNDNSNHIKQINHVAAPIRLDSNGNPIKEEVKVVTQMSTGNVIPLSEQKKIVKKTKEEKEHDSTNMVFIVIFLIILAVLVGLMFYLIIPRYNHSKELKIVYNDKVITTSATDGAYTLNRVSLSSDSFITSDFEKEVVNYFKIKTVSNNGVLNIYVNDKMLYSATSLFSNVAYVDDLLLIGVKNSAERTTKLLVVDTNGEIIKEYYNLGSGDGLTIMSDATSIIFNEKSIILITSRINNKSIIMNNDFGSTTGYDICNSDELYENKISDSTLAMAYFQINYMGYHNFTEEKSINNITLNKYLNDNNLCE